MNRLQHTNLPYDFSKWKKRQPSLLARRSRSLKAGLQLVIAALVFSNSVGAAELTEQTADQLNDGGATTAALKLLQQSDLRYVGAFRLPRGKLGVSKCSYGGKALAYNAKNNSLFMVGHSHHQAVGEFAIPTRIVNDPDVNELTVATVLQPFFTILDRVPNYTLEGNTQIGGLLVIDDRIIGTVYEYYDADTDARDSHFVISSLNLENANVAGLFQVGQFGGGFVGGFMTEVPPEWQPVFGSNYLTGQAALSIMGRTSAGPAAFTFDPAALAINRAAKARPLVFYPPRHRLGWETNPVYNGTSKVTGMVFPAATRSVLFFGSHGTNEVSYGLAKDANDQARPNKGYHSKNGEYEYQVWAYDAQQLVAVNEKRIAPWSIRPYAVWHLTFPQNEPGKRIGGAAWDASRRRLYVSQLRADFSNHRSQPLIQVFEIPHGKSGIKTGF